MSSLCIVAATLRVPVIGNKWRSKCIKERLKRDKRGSVQMRRGKEREYEGESKKDSDWGMYMVL